MTPQHARSDSETRAWPRPGAGPPPEPGTRGDRLRSRRRRTRVLVVAVVVLVIAALGFLGWNLLRGSAATVVTLTLTTAEVKIGQSYFAAATGFAPGEPVRFSWAGPTTGEMGTFPANAVGGYRHGPIIERDPPGAYTITATGLMSGTSASSGLRVVAATPGP